MDIFIPLIAEAKRRSGTVVFTAGNNDRMLRAARWLADDAIAYPVVLGEAEAIQNVARAAKITLTGIATRNPADERECQDYSGLLRARNPEMEPADVEQLLSDPLHFACLMLAHGDAQTMIAGSGAIADALDAAAAVIGPAESIATPSAFALIGVPNFLGQGPKFFIYADCAVTIDPSPQQLADIALSSAKSAIPLLPDPPRVAFLSSATRDASAPSALPGTQPDKIAQALEIVKARWPDLLADGAFEADVALTPALAAAKLSGNSPVAGRANVLIFPNLEAGHIATGLTQYMAGAKSIGPILQGFAHPICLIPEGATANDIATAAAAGLLQSDSSGLH